MYDVEIFYERAKATGTCISAPLRAMPAYPLVLRSATVHVMHASASTCLRPLDGFERV